MATFTDFTGAVVARYSYDAWGALTSSSEQVPQRLRYGGYWYDQEFGWYWVGVRSYAPGLERWLAPDPSQQDGVRTYVYVAVPLFVPPPALCTDNGAMIAAAGYYRLADAVAPAQSPDVQPGLALPTV